jgi:3-oxoacyl-[acyl-carrier protein] reductase
VRINVNCIAPGYIKVDRGKSPVTSDFETALMNNIPWGRLGTPADVAPAALFLASPAADYITGEVLSVKKETAWHGTLKWWMDAPSCA